jgi:hypothetical protein
MQQLDSKLDKAGTSTQEQKVQSAHGQTEDAGGLPPIGEEDYSDDFDDGIEGGAAQQQQGNTSATPPIPSRPTEQLQGVSNAGAPAGASTSAAPRPQQQASTQAPVLQHSSYSSAGATSAGGAFSSSGGAAHQSPSPMQESSLPTPVTAPSQPDILAEGPFRSFALTLDVRTFQAGRKLPLNTCSTYIQALLPADVLGM